MVINLGKRVITPVEIFNAIHETGQAANDGTLGKINRGRKIEIVQF